MCHVYASVFDFLILFYFFDAVGYSSRLLSEVARKRLWKRCLGLLSDPLCLQEHVVICSLFLGAFCLGPFLSNSSLVGMY